MEVKDLTIEKLKIQKEIEDFLKQKQKELKSLTPGGQYKISIRGNHISQQRLLLNNSIDSPICKIEINF